MASETIAYDKSDLRAVTRAFKAMDAEATTQAKKISGSLVEYLKAKIIVATHFTESRVDDRIAEGAVVSKSSKIGEVSFGFARQQYSGGGTTQMLWGGSEFGSIKHKQFNRFRKTGYFIYPTLRREQPYILDQWENGFSEIIKEWT